MPYGPGRAGPVGAGVGCGCCYHWGKVYVGCGVGSHGGLGWSWKVNEWAHAGFSAGIATGWGIGKGFQLPWMDETNLDDLVPDHR